MATVVVAVLALDHVLGFELMIPGQVFGMANLAVREKESSTTTVGRDHRVDYDVRICAPQRVVRTVAEWGGVEIHAPHGLDAIAGADIVIVPGTRNFLDPVDAGVARHLRAAFDGGARLASVCVGAFTLAGAGLLDGRRATTHWQWSAELARRHPEIDVDPAVLFIDDGQVLTSAGVASGIDLCLHLVRQHAGAELAALTSRRLVVPAWRDGGQAQFIEHPDPSDAETPLQATIAWMERNALNPLSLSDIARQASMSVRTLNRQFQLHVGTTPQQLLLRLRVDRARRLLESTQLSMDRVADESGFGSYASLLHHFHRVVGVTPQRYRSQYLVTTAPGPGDGR
ncbi:helix-turn-helix domain-containing protein [Mycolicibacterium sp. P9-64]|uniref:GlxA family transcriptional regulator n=1 Tax=Mycolicibacterium sp. P9-64 TaxID=2024612 RepID=UPI0011EF354D|nr:helix-turn-helix domain-containing protein [Mycolicibacterium sp. P9-64]KAA0079492.1 helix-turn-helix domain-containing protein [Mycolicibacterium sp. P9-64]